MEFIFNSVNIDDTIEEFTTVNAENRGLTSYQSTFETIQGRNGDLLINSQLPGKDIVVHFLIKTENDRDYRRVLDKLNRLLISNKEQHFSFTDEDGFRIGIVTSVENPPFDQNQGVGKITIHCSNPYRFVQYRELSISNGGRIPMSEIDSWGYEWSEILGTTNATSVEMFNVTTGQKIKLNDLGTNASLRISKDDITHGTNKVVTKLDHTVSVWKSFKINPNDQITFSGISTLTIKCFEVMI